MSKSSEIVIGMIEILKQEITEEIYKSMDERIDKIIKDKKRREEEE